MIAIFKNLLKFVLLPRIWSVLVHVNGSLKRMCALLLAQGFIYISVRLFN